MRKNFKKLVRASNRIEKKNIQNESHKTNEKQYFISIISGERKKLLSATKRAGERH